MTSNSSSLRIEQLGKDNFDTWKLQARAVLIKNDAWDYVDGSKTRPEIFFNDQNSITAAAAWDKADLKAQSDLILAISPTELRQIKNCKTARDIWLKLHTIYESKGPARKATLLKHLILRKMSETDNMRDHMTTFFETVDKLEEMDIKVNEELLTILLLYSIPEAYENFRIAIESRDELPKPEVLKIKLLEEYEARKNRGEEKETSGAMFVKKFQKEDSKQSNKNYDRFEKKFKYKCSKCNRYGHMAKDCYSKTKKTIVKESQAKIVKERTEVAMIIETSKTNTWCIDSGATSHMCFTKGKFREITDTQNRSLSLANAETTKIQGIGTIGLIVQDNEGTRSIRLEKSLYVPDLRTNLMSVSKITDKGLKVIFEKESAQIQDNNGKILAIAERKNDLYYIENQGEENDEVNSAAVKTIKYCEIEEWHARLGHLNENSLRDLMKNNKVFGLRENKEKLNTCEICIKGKHSQTPFPKATLNRATEVLEMIHTDVCGPMRTKSLGGSKYFVTFIDDKSRWCEIYFLKQKNEVYGAFLKFKSLVENQFEKKIKIIRSDNGTEYRNSKLEELFEKCGIRHQLTVEYTPQQNGVAERKNRTIVEMARCMMIQSNLSPSFWAEAISTAVYIRNHCPSRSLKGEIPYTIWNGRKPTVSHLRIFGSKVFMLDKKPGKDKFEPRSKECIFVGYETESKAYRLWCSSTRKIHKSRDVKFTNMFQENHIQEDFMDDEEKKIVEIEEKPIQLNDENEIIEFEETPIQFDEEDEEILAETQCENIENIPEPLQDNSEQMKRGPGRPTSIKTGMKGRPKKQYHMVNVTSDIDGEDDTEISNLTEVEDPRTVSEAFAGCQANKWKEAMKKEYDALIENKVWELVDRPNNRQIIGSKWVLRTKFKSDGTIERHKARLVAKGYNQNYGIDYFETFAPVARSSSIRMVMALATEMQLIVHQLDVTTAYLNGSIDEEVFMEIPEKLGEIINNKNFTQNTNGKVYRLKKALYGLKQSGRQWNKKLDERLKELKLKPLSVDPCIYLCRNKNIIVLVAIYVDDIIIASNCNITLNDLKKDLSKTFKMKDLGPIHYCLGVEFKQTKKIIKMNQRKYVEDILKRFQMEDCKSVSTPLAVGQKLSKEMCPKNGEEIEEMKDCPYQNLIGALMYLATFTRPDIAYAVSVLSQYNTNYGKEHWIAAKRVLRYLKGTINHGLVYQQKKENLIGYTDADWGSNIDDRRSYTGFVFKFANAVVSWEARKQRTVALSSTEAEYMAISEATKEAIHLRKFIFEVQGRIKAVTLYNDNMGAQKLVSNPIFHSRTKHIDIRYHFVRDAAENQEIELKYMRTEEMQADVLTKGLNRIKHEKLIEDLGIRDLTEE